VSIGRPIGNIRMYVLDERLNPLPVGAVGELCIGGLGVARGYWGRPGLTAEKFVPEPYGAPGDRMYRTGDLARFRADGNLEFLGRADHQVKIRGYRVELGEIEARLLLHPDVSEAVVAARKDSPGHKRLAGYLVAAGDATPDPAVLRAHLAATLPEHMVPATLTVLDHMPLTQAGKVDRAALPSPDRLAAPASVAPGTETELILAAIWADVLGVDEIGVHDDFFTLGGDSILSIRIGARAREVGIPVTVRQVFEHRTVAALAAAVEPGPVVRVHAEQGSVTGTVPLTPILRWFTDTHGDLAHYNQSVAVECTTDPAVLGQALVAVVRHHDALRLRLRDGVIDHTTEVPDDLLMVVAGARSEEIADDLQASLSPADGQLLRAALFTGEGLLLIAVHHIAVDTVSWDILLADLDTACTQLEAGQEIRLPAKTTSFRDWALRLRDAAVDTTPVAPGTDLPYDHDGEPATEATTAWVDVTLPAETTGALLRQAPAAYRVGGWPGHR